MRRLENSYSSWEDLQNTIFVDPTPPGDLQTTGFLDPALPGGLQTTIFVNPAPPGDLQTIIFVDPAPHGVLETIILFVAPELIGNKPYVSIRPGMRACSPAKR